MAVPRQAQSVPAEFLRPRCISVTRNQSLFSPVAYPTLTRRVPPLHPLIPHRRPNSTHFRPTRNFSSQQRAFIPLSREREVSRARARRALAGGWAVPRQIVSLSPTAPPLTTTAASNISGSGDGERGTAGYRGEAATAAVESGGVGTGDGYSVGSGSSGGAKVVAASGGFRHTVLVTNDGRIYVFGEGSAVAGGDLSALEGKGGAALREAGGLVRRRRSEQRGREYVEGPDAVEVSRATPAGVTEVGYPTCTGFGDAVVSAPACCRWYSSISPLKVHEHHSTFVCHLWASPQHEDVWNRFHGTCTTSSKRRW